MSWQESITALIVALAVWSLYRHLRDLMGSARPDAPAGCHGCDDCETDAPATPARTAHTRPIGTGGARVH